MNVKHRGVLALSADSAQIVKLAGPTPCMDLMKLKLVANPPYRQERLADKRTDAAHRRTGTLTAAHDACAV